MIQAVTLRQTVLPKAMLGRANAAIHVFSGSMLALGALDLDLDEFVRLERALDLGNDGRGEAVVGDRDDGVEVMGACAQVAALGRGELGHGYSLGT